MSVIDKNYDVIVVGSGPAGSTCAIECAKQGLHVAVIEKLSHPRVKVCGGGVVKRAYDACPINIDASVGKKVYQIDLMWHRSRLKLSTKQKDPIIYMVQRKNLDKQLLDEALAQDVDYYPNTILTSIKEKHEEVEVTSKELKLTSQWLIGADGASGTTAKLAGWQEAVVNSVPAIDAEIVVTPELASKLATTRFDFDAIKQGYGWVFPKGDHFSIGIGAFQPNPTSNKKGKKEPSLREHFDSYLKFLNITKENIISIKQKGFVIPLSSRADGVAKNRVLLVGDAAGLADPLTAEGISAAILSGKFAAESIHCPANNLTVAQTYIKKLEKELLIDLRVSEKLSRLLYQYPSLSKFFLAVSKKRSIKAISAIFTGERRFSQLQLQGSWFRKLIFSRILKNTEQSLP